MIVQDSFKFTLPTGTGPSGGATTPVVVRKVSLPERGFIHDVRINLSAGWFYALALSGKDPADVPALEFGGSYPLLDEIDIYGVATMAVLNASVTTIGFSHPMKAASEAGWCALNEPYAYSGLWFYMGPLAGLLAPVEVEVSIVGSPVLGGPSHRHRF